MSMYQSPSYMNHVVFMYLIVPVQEGGRLIPVRRADEAYSYLLHLLFHSDLNL